MNTLKQSLPPTHQTISPEAEQWRSFEREMAEKSIAALQLNDPQKIYLAACEEVYAAYQERWHRTRKQYDVATILEISVQATHTSLAKRSSYGLLYTLGYGMFGAGPIIEQLVKLGVIIYDIRFSPRSRVHRWRKPFLQNWLKDSYIHLPELGNIHYTQPGLGIELADPATGVPLIVQPLREGRHIALMCVCKEHGTCHRRIAAHEVLKQIPEAILVPFPALESFETAWKLPGSRARE